MEFIDLKYLGAERVTSLPMSVDHSGVQQVRVIQAVRDAAR